MKHFLAFLAIISTATFLATIHKLNTPKPMTIDDIIELALQGIAIVESGNKDIKTHSDGKSNGKYGITPIAVEDLILEGKIEQKEYDLTDPSTNKMLADKFLRLMIERHGKTNSDPAVKVSNGVRYYHSKHPRLNGVYLEKVRAAIRGLK